MKIEPGKTVEWYTPMPFVHRLEERFGKFDLDPCATFDSAKAPFYYTKETDGLARTWFGNVFMNPPYGREIVPWVEKAAKESIRPGVEGIVALLPASVDTDWWHDYVEPYIDVEMKVHGRIRFLTSEGEYDGNPMFKSLVVRYRSHPFGIIHATIEAETPEEAEQRKSRLKERNR